MPGGVQRKAWPPREFLCWPVEVTGPAELEQVWTENATLSRAVRVPQHGAKEAPCCSSLQAPRVCFACKQAARKVGRTRGSRGAAAQGFPRAQRMVRDCATGEAAQAPQSLHALCWHRWMRLCVGCPWD